MRVFTFFVKCPACVVYSFTLLVCDVKQWNQHKLVANIKRIEVEDAKRTNGAKIKKIHENGMAKRR